MSGEFYLSSFFLSNCLRFIDQIFRFVFSCEHNINLIARIYVHFAVLQNNWPSFYISPPQKFLKFCDVSFSLRQKTFSKSNSHSILIISACTVPSCCKSPAEIEENIVTSTSNYTMPEPRNATTSPHQCEPTISREESKEGSLQNRWFRRLFCRIKKVGLVQKRFQSQNAMFMLLYVP